MPKVTLPTIVAAMNTEQSERGKGNFPEKWSRWRQSEEKEPKFLAVNEARKDRNFVLISNSDPIFGD